MKTRSRRVGHVSIEEAHENENKAAPCALRDNRPNPEQHYSQKELREILDKTINELEPRYRSVFHLRDVQDLSTEETAQTLDLSPAAVKARLRRARLQLREALLSRFRWSHENWSQAGRLTQQKVPTQ